jgi:hypothetical protein
MRNVLQSYWFFHAAISLSSVSYVKAVRVVGQPIGEADDHLVHHGLMLAENVSIPRTEQDDGFSN